MHEPFVMKWPNWIDVVALTLILRMGYNGSLRGFFTEILNLTASVSITAFTVNYAGLVTGWLQPQWWPAPHVTELAGFWGFFLVLVIGVRLLLKRVAQLIKWERIHWIIQGMGMLLGGLRGLWWSGFFVIVLASSGVTWLRQGVEERSLIGPALLSASRAILEDVAGRFPGAQPHGAELVPAIIQSDETHATHS